MKEGKLRKDIIEDIMNKVNSLKVISRKRAFYQERPLDNIEIHDFVDDEIYDGHLTEIAVFAILGTYQRYSPDYINFDTTVEDDKNGSDLIIKLNDEPEVCLDIKSSYNRSINKRFGKKNNVEIQLDMSGSNNLFDILLKVDITDIEIRRRLGRDTYYRMISEVNEIWNYYMEEFNLVNKRRSSGYYNR